MQGWSIFKQGRLEEALRSFFGVLDLKVAGREGRGGLETLAGLTRADRELVEDTFRVTSISLANLKGAEIDPRLHRLGGAAELRVPRLRAARRADSSGCQTRTGAPRRAQRASRHHPQVVPSLS